MLRRVWEALGAVDVVATLWWLLQGMPTPDLGAWTAPAPGWLLVVLGLVLTVAASLLAAMVGLCVQAVVQPRG